MSGWLLSAVLVSATAVGMLAWRDPKRLRALTKAGRGMRPLKPLTARARRWLGLVLIMPGIVFAMANAWIALLVWSGATCMAGWLVAQAFGSRMAPPED